MVGACSELTQFPEFRVCLLARDRAPRRPRRASVQLTQTAAVATAEPHRVGARRDMDRRALVERANVIVTCVDPRAALTVGNGQTAFTADVTGLQTLNSTYISPPLQMQTHADFGWHTTPPPTGVNPLRFKETAVVARNHSALYPVTQTGQAAEWAWLRANPHRLSLLRLFLRRSSGVPIAAADVQSIRQTLHLWNGTP